MGEELPPSAVNDSSLARHLLRALLQEVVNGIVLADERGTVLAFNPGAEKLFGYKAADIIGRNLAMLMPEPHSSHHDGYMRRYLDTGERRVIGIGREVTALHRDGTTFPIHLAVGAVDVKGIRQFVGVITKITTFAEIQGIIQAMQSVVRGGLKRAVHALEASPGKLGVMQEFDKVERLLKQVELHFRLNTVPMSFSVVDLKGLLETNVARHHGKLQVQGIIFQTDPALLKIRGTAKYLDLMMQILLDNAGRYSKDGKAVINVGGEDGYAVVALTNRGAVPSAWRECLFQLCSTDMTAGRPFGLSLVNAQLVAARHGGRIVCDSDEDTTTFTVHLPLASTSDLAGSPPTRLS